MKNVDVDDVAMQLSRMLDEVARGVTVTITRNGKPVARLVPMRERRRTANEAIEALLAFRDEHSLDGPDVRELIDEGRR